MLILDEEVLASALGSLLSPMKFLFHCRCVLNSRRIKLIGSVFGMLMNLVSTKVFENLFKNFLIY